uniref:2-oxo-4-hydroxy-4-carboxy-5-ureidoimidazoline decarboxylase n=1 Tax=Picocystis salinarum TaxID=88271 RepID=A0A7S3XAQ9_9CHLO
MERFNAFSHEEAVNVLYEWCACRSWAERVANARPFENSSTLRDLARQVWWRETTVAGWLEAFLGHPKIGDLEDLHRKFHGKAEDSEQAAALATNDQKVLQELANYNRAYDEKFGHIFIICAAGKSAETVLSEIKKRLPNTPHMELANAAGEQMKITEARLHNFLTSRGMAETPSMQRRTGQIHSHLVQGMCFCRHLSAVELAAKFVLLID